MIFTDKFVLSRPQPYEEVGPAFLISGVAPLSWLKHQFGYSNSISVELINIRGQTIAGSSITVPFANWITKIIRKVPFSETYYFTQFNVPFIKESQGRMVLKLSGQNEKEQSVFIPLVIKELEPPEGPDPGVIQKQAKMEETIRQYEKDLVAYYKESEKIRESRQHKDEIFKNKDENAYSYASMLTVGNILGILEEANESFPDYLYGEEDNRERELKEKYKDALEWRGPLFHGLAAMLDGFEFRVYSNDHGKHFHVIHRGKGINARFLFPEIELLNYKDSRNTIGSKEERRIKEFFKNPENLKKLEAEFKRRS